MTSPALTTWQSSRLPRLDRLIALHPDAAGSTTDPAVTTEWTHALVLRLTSEFQGFCRDLHNDLAWTIARLMTGQEGNRLLIFKGLTKGRVLDCATPVWKRSKQTSTDSGLTLHRSY